MSQLGEHAAILRIENWAFISEDCISLLLGLSPFIHYVCYFIEFRTCEKLGLRPKEKYLFLR